MKPKKCPRFKSKIAKVPARFEVYEPGDSCAYRTATTREEALKIKKEMEQEARDRWKQRNAADVLEFESARRTIREVTEYLSMLQSELWHLQRARPKNQEAVDQMKEVIKNLKGFLDGKLEVRYEHFGGGRYIEEVEADDE